MAEGEAIVVEKIGVQGGQTAREKLRETPRLHIYGASFASARAHLALRCSTAWPGTEIRLLDVCGATYQPAYARLNPNMTVPTLEIEDQLLTDSDTIAEYLRQQHPGKGDIAVATSGRTDEVHDFCRLVLSWDEAMHTWGKNSGERGGGFGELMNRLRDIRLRQNYQRLADPREKMWDGRTISQSYEEKIAFIADLTRRVDCRMTPEKRAAFAHNERALHEIFTEAERLLGERHHGGDDEYLFGPHLCTADIYLCPLLFRIQHVDSKELTLWFQKFPKLEGYYDRFCQSPEGKQAVTKFHKAWAMRYLRNQCIPCQIFRVNWGCLRPATLEPAAEARIKELIQQRQVPQHER